MLRRICRCERMPDEDWSVWTQRVRRTYKEINDMFKVAKGAPKYDEEDFLSKLLETNPHYTKLMNPTILAMEAQRQDYTVDEWLKALTALGDEDKRVNKGIDTGYANMARTTTALPVQPGTTFRATLDSSQAKVLLCNNWNGKPGSCPWAENCRFNHSKDVQVRNAHLKKVKERKAALQAKKDQWRADKEKSAENASSAASDGGKAPVSAGGKAPVVTKGAKDYAKVARAMLAMMDDLSEPLNQWPDVTKGKQAEERREKERREKEKDTEEEEKEKETEKRKEEARKVRKKIADSRYAEYDVSGYGLSGIVEEEEVKVECSNLYCLSTTIELSESEMTMKLKQLDQSN